VLGYLVAGTVIGDYGLGYVQHKDIELLGEFGVVFLLFAIGLELSFERLKAMRKYVLGLGSMQVLITTVIIAGAVVMFTGSNATAIIIGGGLALSSTAVVMQVIEGSGNASTQTGRISLAILLLQDFIVVPLLVVIPLLAKNNDSAILHAVGLSFIKAIVALVAIFIAGRLFLRPLFGLIPADRPGSNELFIGATLLIVLSAAWGTEHFGLSLALGAFVAGVLVAETEFRLQAEESIYPFKGLLLGLFFMSVGMSIDWREIYNSIDKILIFSISLIVVKALIISGLCILFGFSKGVSLHSGLLLSQGGEFAFILFNLAMDNNIISHNIGKMLLLIVTCTMALTPLLSALGEKIAERLEEEVDINPVQTLEKGTSDITQHVIIAGFGKVGKMVARVLEAEVVNYIALDINADVVKEEQSSGFPIFKGDIGQVETLKAAAASRALSIILTIDNEVTIKKALKVISSNFQNLAIIIRTHDLRNSSELYEAGATMIVPEDYETGLQLGGAVLKSVGISENEITRIKNQFRAGSYVMAQTDEEVIDEYETN
ncbi:MAG: cation:proton antiporter, partial [Rickettsiaceae bacterium]|nr:cation:proton antiporter [Rickettsiaceae bacterium]